MLELVGMGRGGDYYKTKQCHIRKKEKQGMKNRGGGEEQNHRPILCGRGYDSQAEKRKVWQMGGVRGKNSKTTVKGQNLMS